jgi:predicted Fe-S protein YdhL (DUF1289 family)
MKIKIPSQEDFNNFNGRSCHKLWNQLEINWKCPGCNRTKFELMRWTEVTDLQYKGSTKKKSKGWSANLHRHHDHSQNKCVDYGEGRFNETIICCDCNSADSAAKKKLHLPEYFSFSPAEINQFIKPIAHGKHEINYDIAKNIFMKLHGQSNACP